MFVTKVQLGPQSQQHFEALSLGTGTATQLLKHFILQRNGSKACGSWTLILSVTEIRKKHENEKNHLWKCEPLMTTPPAACSSLCFLLFSEKSARVLKEQPRPLRLPVLVSVQDKDWTDRWTTHLLPTHTHTEASPAHRHVFHLLLVTSCSLWYAQHILPYVRTEPRQGRLMGASLVPL